MSAEILVSSFNPHAKQPGTLIVVQSAYHLIGLLIVRLKRLQVAGCKMQVSRFTMHTAT